MRNRTPKILAMTIVLMMIASLTLIVPSIAAVSAPKAVAGLSAVSASSSSIKLTWKAVSGAAGYTIYRSSSSSGTYSSTGDSKSATFTNTGLKTGTTYYYKVKAYVMSGKTKVYGAFSNVAFAKPAASTPSKVAANYKDVVVYGCGNDVWMAQLAPEGFSVNKTYSDAPDMHSFSIWREVPVKYTDTDPTMKALNTKALSQSPRYFRVNLTKEQKSGKDANKNFMSEINKGKSPTFVFGWNWQLPVPVGSAVLPKTSKKILINFFSDGYFNKSAMKSMDKNAEKYLAELKTYVEPIHKAVPNATLYVCSAPMQSGKFPRFENQDVAYRWAGLMGALLDMGQYLNNKAYRDIINGKIKSYCDSNKYVFVDWNKAGITDSNGSLLEECVHPQSAGGHLNQLGATRVGDYMCKIMGLKTAKEMYGLK